MSSIIPLLLRFFLEVQGHMFPYIFFKYILIWLTLSTPLPSLIPTTPLSASSLRLPIVPISIFHFTCILSLPPLSSPHFYMLYWQHLIYSTSSILKNLSRIWFCFCVSLSSHFLSHLLESHSQRSAPVLITLSVLKDWTGKECLQKYSSGK